MKINIDEHLVQGIMVRMMEEIEDAARNGAYIMGINGCFMELSSHLEAAIEKTQQTPITDPCPECGNQLNVTPDGSGSYSAHCESCSFQAAFYSRSNQKV